MIYALDTNIIIHYLRDEPRVCQEIYSAISQGDKLIIPNVVNYEIKRGFEVQSAPRKEKEYRILTEQGGFCDIIEMDANAWERAERVFAELYHKHLTVGEMDILIGAFCLENNCTLVTNNIKDFKDIDGLEMVDWLEEASK
ncbi:MAG: PIN domain-containing protein [Oscillospiraceae bacterium]|nr:PIN domain-containing protein [Oscillospiraceae bacterium]